MPMKHLKTIVVSVCLLAASFIEAEAAEIHVKNCANESVKICTWNAADPVAVVPKSEARLGSRDSRNFSCPGSYCKFRVTGKSQGCRYRNSGKKTKQPPAKSWWV
jgi:hypothetical protein